MIFSVIIIVIIYLLYLFNKYRKLPPGPYGVPILGYYPFLKANAVDALSELSKKYPDVMTMTLVGETFWFLHSYEAIEEALFKKGDIFSGRNIDDYSLPYLITKSPSGLVGAEWKVNRGIILRCLSKLGMGKSELECKLHILFDRVEHFVENTNGEASNFFNILTNYSFNSISTMIINEEFDVNDEGYNLFRAHMMQVFVTIMGFNTILCGNIWKFWNKVRPSSEKRLLENFAKMREFGCKLLNERLQKQKVISDYELDDMIDFWIKESSGANGKYCTVDTIPDKIVLLLMAGNDAVAILAHQSLTMMALYPDVQKKVLLEITDTFPNVENIYYSDKNQLHYTSAVLDEIQRISLIQPFTLPNVNNEETTIRGYHVPKGTKVVANLFDVMRSEKLFKNPLEFDPNNFLDENGEYKRNKALLLFGTGPRICVAVRLVQMQIFISFIRLIRKFEWSVENDVDVKQTTQDLIRGKHLFLNLCAKKRDIQ